LSNSQFPSYDPNRRAFVDVSLAKIGLNVPKPQLEQPAVTLMPDLILPREGGLRRRSTGEDQMIQRLGPAMRGSQAFGKAAAPCGRLCLSQSPPNASILTKELFHDLSTPVSQGGGLERPVLGQTKRELVFDVVPPMCEAEMPRGKGCEPAAAEVTLHQTRGRINNDLT
jgi:hypothetical protein